MLKQLKVCLNDKREEIGVYSLAAWFVVSLLSQHPDRGYDRLRKWDPTGLFIPNWRFFAPEPAVDDTHLLYRLQAPSTGDYTEWRSANVMQKRKMRHAAWFPGRREEKAVFDVTAGLLSNVNAGISSLDQRKDSAFQLLSNYIRRSLNESTTVFAEIDPGEYTRFQWMVVRFSGYAESEDVGYDFVSPVVDLEPSKEKR